MTILGVTFIILAVIIITSSIYTNKINLWVIVPAMLLDVLGLLFVFGSREAFLGVGLVALGISYWIWLENIYEKLRL